MQRLVIFTLFPIGLLLFVLSKCQTIEEGLDSSPSAIESSPSFLADSNAIEKQGGAHVFGRIDSSNFHFLKRNNIEWITLVAWADQKDFDSPNLRHHRGDSVRIRRSDSSWLRRIEFAHSAGFKVFVKPHIWMHAPTSGKWRSDIYPTNEENWETWKKSYREFILHYANLAQQTNAEMFCIGTELSSLTVEKPAFWAALLEEVRSIYSGKITYAANWYEEYEEITFWSDLDYIGIQAYFPLTKNENPSVEQISKGWNQHLPSLAAIHKKYKRPILFTEIGYKSTTDSAINPWEWIDYSKDQNKTISTETQANCYEAFFNTVWTKEWIAGAHIWELRGDYEEAENDRNKLDFTPLGKPAEKIIARGFE